MGIVHEKGQEVAARIYRRSKTAADAEQIANSIANNSIDSELTKR